MFRSFRARRDADVCSRVHTFVTDLPKELLEDKDEDEGGGVGRDSLCECWACCCCCACCCWTCWVRLLPADVELVVATAAAAACCE